jgi:protein-S-isoprenylcysteine O-methyltransferase Ste14
MTTRLSITRLLIVPVLLLVLLSDHLHPEGSLREALLEVTGLILLVAAMGGRIWASAHLAGRKDRTLVTSGPYSLTRNPLYLFSLFGFVGAGLVFESITGALLMGVVFFVAHWPTIHREEARLERLFGDEYRRYAARVPRFAPALRLPESPAEMLVDTRRFNAALRDALAVPMVVVVAELVEWAKLSGVLPVLLELP